MGKIMKHFSNCRLVAVLLFLFGTTSRVDAEFIPWSYSSSPVTDPLHPGILVSDPHGTGGIALTRMNLKHENGTADILLTVINPFSAALPSHPDRVSNRAYKLTLVVRDDGSGVSTKLTFAGAFNGTFSPAEVHLGNTFTGAKTQKVHLGHFWYTVSIGPYVAPTAATVGTISAHVSVQHNPEPPSLLLAGLGLSALGLVGLRSWRRALGPGVPPP
jgi:hypothetical protein